MRIPAVAAAIALVDAVGERPYGAHEVLGRAARKGIAVAVVPETAQVYLDLVLDLIVVVHTEHLGSIQSVVAASSATPSACAGESVVVYIVGIAEEHEAVVAVEVGTHQFLAISAVRTYGEVDVGEDTLVHTFLEAEIKHRILLTVVDTGNACQVTLLLVGFHLFHDRRGEILHGYLGVAGHKLLAVHQNLLHLLAVVGNLAVLVDGHAGQALDQFLDGRALGCAERRAIVYKGVFLYRHLHGLSHHLCLFQHDGIGLHHDFAYLQIFLVLDFHMLDDGLVAHARYAEHVALVFGCLDGEDTLVVADGSGHIRTVGGKQLYRCLDDWFFRVAIYQDA